MEQGNLRKWHLGLGVPLLSAVLVWSYTQIEPTANPRTTSPMIFEQALLSPPVGKSNPQPVISDVRVYPSVDGLYLVNFKQLVADRKNDAWLKQEWSFTARTPRNGSSEDVLTWLRRLSAQYPQAKFTYEWWREPGRLWTIWGAFSAILLLWGVVVPTIMWFAKGGYAEFKANAKAVEEAEAQTALATAGPSAADMDRLNNMIDNLESNVAASATPGGQRSTADSPDSPAIRKLEGKPLEVAQQEKEEEKRDYKGEFYPVARAAAPKGDSASH